MESIAYKVAIVNVQGATSYALFTNAFRSYQVDFEIDRSPNSSERQSFEFELKNKENQNNNDNNRTIKSVIKKGNSTYT